MSTDSGPADRTIQCSQCGHELHPHHQFCEECGAARPQLTPAFAAAERTYRQLRAEYEQGTLDKSEFETALQEAMIQDADGAFWMLGVESGRWYRHDGEVWQRAEPPLLPGATPPPPPSASVPESSSSRRWPWLLAALLLVIGAFALWRFVLAPPNGSETPQIAVIDTPTATTILILPAATATMPATSTPADTATPIPATPIPTGTPTLPLSSPTPTGTSAPPTSVLPPARIAFVSREEGDAEIYAANADGSDLRRLTQHAGDDLQPVWSPDGQRIAYLVEEDGALQLWVMEADGGNKRLLTTGDAFVAGAGAGVRSAAWSPDGERIALSFEGDDLIERLYIIDDEGAILLRPGDGRQPDWSPDGARLAYSAPSANAAFAIFSIAADGGDLRQLTGAGGDASHPRWSPEGETIAYALQNGDASAIMLYDLRASTSRTLVDLASNGFDWSPDGSQLLFAPPGGGIWAVSVEGPPGLMQVFTQGSMPAWQPGTRALALATVAEIPTATATFLPPSATPTPSPSATATVATATSRPPTPTSPPPSATPTPSPAPLVAAQMSGRIAFPVFAPDRGTFDVYVANPDGSGMQRVIDYASQPALSPDGSRLAFRRWAADDRGLEVMDTLGGNRRRLTNFVEDALPSWSPDSRTLAFLSRRESDRRSRLYEVDVAGAYDWEPQRDGGPVFGEYPTWMPAGPIVYRALWPQQGLAVMNADGGGYRLLVADASATAPAVSPDSAWVAYMSQQAGGWELFKISVQGGDPVRLTNHPANDGLPAWSPDGGTIAFASNRSGAWELWAIDAAGGNLQKLFTLPGPVDGYVPREPESVTRGWVEERISWSP